MNIQEGATHAPVYPIASGTKAPRTASEAAARAVDADPDRKLRVYTAITVVAFLEHGLVPDMIADRVMEPILYVRPRISQLGALGVVVKGAQRISPTHGRTAHIVEPSPDLIRFVADRDPGDDQQLEQIVREFITARLVEEARAQRTARRGADV